MTALTAKQAELLDFIRYHQAANRTSPSFDEMRDWLGLQSKSGVHRLIGALEERGYIRRLRNRARCIEILPDPTLPVAADLSAASYRELANEALRRGLVIGHFHRTKVRCGEDFKLVKQFVELRA